MGYKKADRFHENLEHLGTKVAVSLILRKIYAYSGLNHAGEKI